MKGGKISETRKLSRERETTRIADGWILFKSATKRAFFSKAVKALNRWQGVKFSARKMMNYSNNLKCILALINLKMFWDSKEMQKSKTA